MSTQVLLKPSVIKLALIEAPNSQLCKEMVFIHMYSLFHFFISIAQVDKLTGAPEGGLSSENNWS